MTLKIAETTVGGNFYAFLFHFLAFFPQSIIDGIYEKVRLQQINAVEKAEWLD